MAGLEFEPRQLIPESILIHTKFIAMSIKCDIYVHIPVIYIM